MAVLLVFQFHKGTIKTDDRRNKQALFADFNSIKVRLKRLLLMYCICVVIFQFHKGTIKTNSRSRRRRQGDEFQFHKGTIKTFFALIIDCYTAISIP